MKRKIYEIFVINDDGSKHPEFICGYDSGETEKEAIDHLIFVNLDRVEKWNQKNIITSIRLIAELK